MSRRSATNYTASGDAFTIASATSDSFQDSDLQTLGQAVDDHDHSAGLGLAVKRLVSGVAASKPAASHAGYVYFATDTGHFFLDDGSSWHDATIYLSGDLNSSGQVTVTHLAAALVIAQGGTGNAYGNPNVVTIASAATLALASTSSALITGTTTITDVSGTPPNGQLVAIVFQSAGLQITNGNHWKLQGSTNLTSVAYGCILGVIDGSGNFNEVYRSPGQGTSGKTKVLEAFYGSPQTVSNQTASTYADFAAGFALAVACNAGDRVVLTASCTAAVGSVSGQNCVASLVIDKDAGTKLPGAYGSAFNYGPSVIPASGGFFYYPLTAVFVDDAVTAATHTYKPQNGCPAAFTGATNNLTVYSFKVEVWR